MIGCISDGALSMVSQTSMLFKLSVFKILFGFEYFVGCNRSTKL